MLIIQRFIKKIIDFIVALIGLIVLSPFFVFIAVLIKIDSKGPVFFKQERVSLNSKVFKIYKFRTMVLSAEKMGLGIAVKKDDERITKIGKFLREWTLDEWPQLIDVLKGEMSLVGPRPLPLSQIKDMNDIQKKRLKVLPGMVSLVDIKGRNLVSWEKRFELDNWYIDNWSLWLDLKILLITPYIIFSRKGVYGEGGVNKPPK